MYHFKLPDLGEGIAEVEVVYWLVQEGDVVQEDQPIAEIQTDKALVEISSPKAGRVCRLCGKGGVLIPVGQVLIEIDDSMDFAAAPGKVQAGPDAGATETATDAIAEVGGHTGACRPRLTPQPTRLAGRRLPPQPRENPRLPRQDPQTGSIPRACRRVPAPVQLPHLRNVGNSQRRSQPCVSWRSGWKSILRRSPERVRKGGSCAATWRRFRGHEKRGPGPYGRARSSRGTGAAG